MNIIHNHVTLIGYITHNIELQEVMTNTGKKNFCRFFITVGTPGRTRGRNLPKKDVFIPVVAWEAQARNVFLRIKKGSFVFIEGHLGRIYNRDKECEKGFEKGKTKLTVILSKILFLDKRKDNEIEVKQNIESLLLPVKELYPHLEEKDLIEKVIENEEVE